MKKPSKSMIMWVSCPDQVVAKEIAESLLQQQLVACVNILPGVTSVYRWQGQIESANEVLLMIKTRADRVEQVQGLVLEQHPYELPEVIAVEIGGGLPQYLNWISEVVE